MDNISTQDDCSGGVSDASTESVESSPSRLVDSILDSGVCDRVNEDGDCGTGVCESTKEGEGLIDLTNLVEEKEVVGVEGGEEENAVKNNNESPLDLSRRSCSGSAIDLSQHANRDVIGGSSQREINDANVLDLSRNSNSVSGESTRRRSDNVVVDILPCDQELNNASPRCKIRLSAKYPFPEEVIVEYVEIVHPDTISYYVNDYTVTNGEVVFYFVPVMKGIYKVFVKLYGLGINKIEVTVNFKT